jgi:hypothetical protein
VVPAAHTVGVQVPFVQVRPVSQVSPAPQAQPWAWAGHVSHRSLAQRSPGSQVPFDRHTHEASPRRQSTHTFPMHSPVVQAPAWQAQPTCPSHEPPASIIIITPLSIAEGAGQPARPADRKAKASAFASSEFFTRVLLRTR